MGDTDELLDKAAGDDHRAQAVLLARISERLGLYVKEVQQLKPALQVIYEKVLTLEQTVKTDSEKLEVISKAVKGVDERINQKASKVELQEHSERTHTTAATKLELTASMAALRTELYSRFDPVRALVYAGVGIVLTTVFTGMVGAAIYFIAVVQGP